MDTVANMLTSLLNAQRVGKARAVVPYSVFKENVAKFLRDKGYVAKVDVKKAKPQDHLVVTLKYDGKKGRMQQMRRLSSPGQRYYVSKDDIPYAADGVGIVVVSTSKGLMDDRQARKEGLGGELICEVW